MARVVFIGSGPVAAESLELLKENFEIEAVITKTPPPHFKGIVPVKEVANKYNYDLYFVEDKNELDALLLQERFVSELAILIDFGIIVSKRAINVFRKGIVNSHFSLLPEWRGADPISFAILSGQEKTGVSLMLLAAGMDEGGIIASKELAITDDDTTETLTKKLIKLSNELLKVHIPTYYNRPTSTDQIVHAQMSNRLPVASYSQKLHKNDGLVDWSKPASVIEREIRAYSTWPKSRTKLGQVEVVLCKAHAVTSNEISNTSNKLIKKCGTGYLVIDELKPAGKKNMTSSAFLAGYKNKI